MAYYRLYIRDGSSSGRFMDVLVIHAPDDEAAMQAAARHEAAFLELWQEGRRVVAFEPDRSKVLRDAASA